MFTLMALDTPRIDEHIQAFRKYVRALHFTSKMGNKGSKLLQLKMPKNCIFSFQDDLK